MTGVDGLDRGEVCGVLILSMEGESGLLIAGDNGGWPGGQLVGVMPGILGLDINWGWGSYSTSWGQCWDRLGKGWGSYSTSMGQCWDRLSKGKGLKPGVFRD